MSVLDLRGPPCPACKRQMHWSAIMSAWWCMVQMDEDCTFDYYADDGITKVDTL